VQPPIFPGGDIGSLAVHGSVNDLAVRGARARALSLALILEEGLPLPLLRGVLDSVRAAAESVGAKVVTGDTKVVRRGQCDGLYLVTAGIGEALPGFRLDRRRFAAGDAVLVSGPIGDHGMAVIAARERMPASDALRSDSAPVLGLVEALVPCASAVKFMRDPTRGGVAAVLNEMVEATPFEAVVEEAALPFHPAARALAEMMGIELIRVACEGRIVAVVAAEAAETALSAWRAHPQGREARRIGALASGRPGRVVMETRTGGRRIVDRPQGEPLPRIC
jgi:hydrogenase expression/formation protein HypE